MVVMLTLLFPLIINLLLQFGSCSSTLFASSIQHQTNLITAHVNTLRRKLFWEDDQNEKQPINPLPATGEAYPCRSHTSRFIIPVLRNMSILCRPPSLASVGFGLSCGLGYYIINAKSAQAKDINQSSSVQLPSHVVIGRVVLFWKKVAPIIIHYKFATFWMNRVKSYDRNERDIIYDSLHDRYAIKAKDVACEMKGNSNLNSHCDYILPFYL